MIESRHCRKDAALHRLWLITRHTLGAARRTRLTILLVPVGAGLVWTAFWLREFNFGTAELKFLGDFGLGVIGFFGMLLAALVTAQLFEGDLASGVACCVLTRPVRRWEYILGLFGGVAAMLALFTAILGSVVAGLLSWCGSQVDAAPLAVPLLLSACAMLWFKMTLVAGMTLLVCSYANTALFASCMGLLLAGIAHLHPLADGRLAWLRLWPNLALFDAESLFASDGTSVAAALAYGAGYWVTYALIFGGLASFVFKHREF